MNYYKERIVPVDYNALWTESLLLEDGNYPERIKNDQVEKEFWKTFIAKKPNYQQDATARIVMKEVEKILSDYDLENLLEIGPGWGNYTVDLSQHCKQLTCLDISEDILTYIQKIAEKMRLNPIKTINSKIEDVQMTQAYDGVFGYNCFYRIKDLRACLKKINNLSRKISMVGMGMGEIPPYYKEMQEQLGLQVKDGKKDYIHFVNILYSMGIDANVKIIPLQKEIIYPTWEEVLQKETTRLLNQPQALETNEKSLREILEKYFKQDEEGKIKYTYTFRGALIYWTPNSLIE